MCKVPFGASGLELTKPSDGNDETKFHVCVQKLSWITMTNIRDRTRLYLTFLDFTSGALSTIECGIYKSLFQHICIWNEFTNVIESVKTTSMLKGNTRVFCINKRKHYLTMKII